MELYRRLAERSAVGRLITGVETPDAWYLKRGLDAGALSQVVGCRVVEARRRGKLLLLDTDGGPTLGLRFGMSGRLVVDGEPGVDRLLYTSSAATPRFERFALSFEGDGRLVMSDPRRLGGVELDPDEDRLGPDVLGVGPVGLRAVLAGGTTALKARLLDQSRLAGVGNLIADETLWRAALDPRRPAGGLADAEVRRLAQTLRRTVTELIERGGSHTGDLLVARQPGGRCPRDGAPLVRGQVGGRTTWWCPAHQR